MGPGFKPLLLQHDLFVGPGFDSLALIAYFWPVVSLAYVTLNLSQLDVENGIPAHLVCKIVQNVKQQDWKAMENLQNDVMMEVQSVLQLHEDANDTSFANHME